MPIQPYTSITGNPVTYPSQGERMPSSGFEAVTKALADGPLNVAHQLRLFEDEAATGKFPADYVTAERARLIALARGADAEALYALEKWHASVAAAARSERIASESEVPAAERTPFLLEKRDLVEGPLSGENLLVRAADFLAAGQPHRADLYFQAAQAKGVRHPSTADMGRAVGDALDRTDDRRARARAIEDDANAKVSKFHEQRYRILAMSAGVGPDGSAAFGSPRERASAHVAATTVAFAEAQRAGVPYVSPPEDGVLDLPKATP